MDHSKKKIAFFSFTLFLLICVIAVFGNVPRLFFDKVNLLDMSVFVFVLYSFFHSEKVKWAKYIFLIGAVFGFSYVLSLTRLSFQNSYIGLLYLVRLISYLVLPIAVYKMAKVKSKVTILKCLLTVGILTSTLGLTQYATFPDLRDLHFIGYDDHYYRLISLHFDPNLVGLLFVLSIVIATFYIKENSIPKYLILFLLSFSIGLTFSRSTYLALFISLGLIIFKYKKVLETLFISLVVIFTIMFSVKPGGEGVNLARTSSISARSSNYSESIQLFRKAPIFGIGFNNICYYKLRFGKDLNTMINSCNGLDSSLFVILTTTGILGSLALIYFSYGLYKQIIPSTYKDILDVSIVSVLVHSLFTNSLFYSWILLFIGVEFGLSLSVKKKK